MTPGTDPTDSGSSAATPPVLTGTTSVARLAVEGMHCGSCVALIEETLGEQDGVTGATVDLETARAVVEYDPSQLDLDEIRAAIADAGYTATPVG